MTCPPSLRSLVLAIADDELVIGHRHSEWTGFAPHLEEDVAFSSIAQDEIGHAAALYGLVARLDDTDADAIALGREAGEYRSAILCERPNRDWAYTLARHWLYDLADSIRLEALEASDNEELAALATKMRREERYHLLHADAWIKRVANGPVEGRTRLIDALTDVFPEATALFEPFELEAEALKEGWLQTPLDELRGRFVAEVARSFDELGLPTEIHSRLDESAEFVASSSGDLIAEPETGSSAPASGPAGSGGRAGRHSDEFQELWDTMTSTYRDNPGATW